MDWTGGYVTNVEYTSGYYRELAPAFQNFVLLAQGIAQPSQKQLRYLELGFGQGLSLLIHAAATRGEFWGTDFNPSHAAGAQELADASAIPAQVFDQSFAEFAERRDLPQFDAIALHGIWSWISAENRHVIVDLLRRHLRPGGVVYISYNTLPGWAAVLPLRHVLDLHARLVGQQSQGMRDRVDAALAFGQRIAEAGSKYFLATPELAERLKRMSATDRDYLAHEYFNADWHPMHFSELAGTLEAAKLTFAASAQLSDYFETRHMDEKAQAMLRETDNVVLRETVRDFITNQQFRRDLFVRGPRRLGSVEQVAALRATRFACLVRPQDVNLEHTGLLGKLKLSERVFLPILEAIAGARSPISVAEIETAVASPPERIENLVSSLVLLAGKGAIQPTQPPETVAHCTAACRRLNDTLIRFQRGAREAQSLASPVTGIGMPVRYTDQLFVQATWAGHTSEPELARHAADAMVAHGRVLTVAGRTMQTRDEILPEMAVQARQFLDVRLASLRRLGIV